MLVLVVMLLLELKVMLLNNWNMLMILEVILHVCTTIIDNHPTIIDYFDIRATIVTEPPSPSPEPGI